MDGGEYGEFDPVPYVVLAFISGTPVSVPR